MKAEAVAAAGRGDASGRDDDAPCCRDHEIEAAHAVAPIPLARLDENTAPILRLRAASKRLRRS